MPASCGFMASEMARHTIPAGTYLSLMKHHTATMQRAIAISEGLERTVMTRLLARTKPQRAPERMGA